MQLADKPTIKEFWRDPLTMIGFDRRRTRCAICHEKIKDVAIIRCGKGLKHDTCRACLAPHPSLYRSYVARKESYARETVAALHRLRARTSERVRPCTAAYYFRCSREPRAVLDGRKQGARRFLRELALKRGHVGLASRILMEKIDIVGAMTARQLNWIEHMALKYLK